MLPVSRLMTLYVTIYGRQPSSHTAAALIRMEEVFGLAQDDTFSRVIVILLQSADRIDAGLQERSAAEKKFVAELRDLMSGLTYLSREIGNLSHKVPREIGKVRRRVSDEDVLGVTASASPLFAYLRHALWARTGVLDADERILAARRDVIGVGVLMIAVACVLVGAGVVIGGGLG